MTGILAVRKNFFLVNGHLGCTLGCGNLLEFQPCNPWASAALSWALPGALNTDDVNASI